jgi:hypothetical protein
MSRLASTVREIAAHGRASAEASAWDALWRIHINEGAFGPPRHITP